MKQTDQVAGCLLLLFAGFVVIQARRLPQWDGSSPGPGFVPFWLGLLLGSAALMLLASRVSRARSSVSWLSDRKSAIRLAVVAALSAGSAALSYAVGMVLSSGLYMAALLFYLEPRSVPRNAITSVVTSLIVWLVFVYWLGVPLPQGALGF